MLWHPDIKNTPRNPYADETIDNLINILKSDVGSQFMQGFNYANPADNREQYPLNLLDLANIYNTDAESGWYGNKMSSPEYIDLFKTAKNNLANNTTGLDTESLRAFYKNQARNMIKANPYNYNSTNSLTDLADYLFSNM